VAVTYANSNAKLKIVGGSMAGQVLDPTGIKALATLPSPISCGPRSSAILVTPATRNRHRAAGAGAQLARVLKSSLRRRADAA